MEKELKRIEWAVLISGGTICVSLGHMFLGILLVISSIIALI